MPYFELMWPSETFRCGPLRIPSFCSLFPSFFRNRDNFVRNLWRNWIEFFGSTYAILPIQIPNSERSHFRFYNFLCDIYYFIPYWIRDPLILSVVVAVVSLTLASSFLGNLSSHGNLSRTISKGMLTLSPTNSNGLNSSCPGCIALEIDSIGGNYILWTKLDLGAHGLLELFISYIISSLVVIFSIFIFHFIK